jgi:DNA-binding LytR/AlgR family response regulator
MIRAIIVDDEEPARERLRRLLSEIDASSVNQGWYLPGGRGRSR